jgi:hypothetical protein
MFYISTRTIYSFHAQLAAELSLTDEPNLRHALRADEAELVALVISILNSKDAEKAILSLEGDAAQCFIDVVQDVSISVTTSRHLV